MAKYFLVSSMASGEIIGAQFTGADVIPPPPTGKEHHECTAETHAQVSGSFRYPANGPIRWKWVSGALAEQPDTRKHIAVSAPASVAQGSPANVTFTLPEEPTFTGEVQIRARTGDKMRLFALSFVNGTKQVNIPTTNLDHSITFEGSEKSYVTGDMTIEITQSLG